MKNPKRIPFLITAICLLCSLSINIILLLPFIIDYLAMDRTPYFDKNATDAEVMESVLRASLNYEESQMKQKDFHGVIAEFALQKGK